MTDSIYSVKEKLEEKKVENENKNNDNNNGMSSCSYGILAFLFLIVTSDVFADNILSAIPGAIENRSVTTFGSIVAAIILILLHILIMNYI
jgi:hypothetical protein